MKSKQKVGTFYLRASVDVPISSEALSKIFFAISKSVLSEGKSLIPADLLEVTSHFQFDSD